MDIIAKAVDTYDYYVWEKSHPKARDYYLLGSPFPVIFLLGLYLVIVFKGPKFMEKRNPFDLKYIMIIYNILQAAINISFVYYAITQLWIPGNYKWVCQEPTPPDFPDSSLHGMIVVKFYHFSLSRLLDLLDTVFMVLRKNQRQVSFLHLYHHFLVALGSWLVSKYIPGGDPAFFGTMNGLVHTIMYSYYLVTAIYPKYKGNLWWKRYITELQIFQFGVLIIQLTIGILTPGCQYPRWLHILFLIQASTITALFINFYIKAYITKKKKTRE